MVIAAAYQCGKQGRDNRFRDQDHGAIRGGHERRAGSSRLRISPVHGHRRKDHQHGTPNTATPVAALSGAAAAPYGVNPCSAARPMLSTHHHADVTAPTGSLVSLIRSEVETATALTGLTARYSVTSW